MNPSPLRYPGGKYKMYNYLKELTRANNVTTYIEPFCGGAGLALQLLIKGDIKKIILNDYDYSIYCFWYCVLYHSNELINMIEKTSINIEEWQYQKKIREDIFNHEKIEVAFSTFFLNRTNRSGIIDKAGPIGGYKQEGSYLIDCRFNKKKLIGKIRLISSMRDQIEIYNLEALDFIDEVVMKKNGSFTFFDPPYFKEGKGLYTNFYSEGDHINLSKKIINQLRYRKWIVTYDAIPEVYNMFKSVKHLRFSLSYSLQKKKKGTEFIFFSRSLKRIEDSKFLIRAEEVI